MGNLGLQSGSPAGPSRESGGQEQWRAVRRAGRVSAFRFSGERFDCGSKAGFLKAAVALGLRRDDLREELLAFLDKMGKARSCPPRDSVRHQDGIAG